MWLVCETICSSSLAVFSAPSEHISYYLFYIDAPSVTVLNILLGQGSKYARNTLYSVVVVSSGKCFSAVKRWSGNVCPFSRRVVAVSFIHHIGAGLDLFLWQSRSQQFVLAGGCSSAAAGLSALVGLVSGWDFCSPCEIPRFWSRIEAAP